MNKMELKEKVELAYFKKHGKPGGWDVFEGKVGELTQEQIAQMFGVAARTSYTWHKEYRDLNQKVG